MGHVLDMYMRTLLILMEDRAFCWNHDGWRMGANTFLEVKGQLYQTQVSYKRSNEEKFREGPNDLSSRTTKINCVTEQTNDIGELRPPERAIPRAIPVISIELIVSPQA